MVLTVELSDEQFRTLQLAQYRNGESLSHTLLRLAKLAPEPKPGPPIAPMLYQSITAQILQAEDARILEALNEIEAAAQTKNGG